jgi:hypothetical protein
MISMLMQSSPHFFEVVPGLIFISEPLHGRERDRSAVSIAADGGKEIVRNNHFFLE